MADTSVWNESGNSDFYQAAALAENGIAQLNNAFMAGKTNKANKEIAHEANEYNYRTAMELATLQPELEYDLWLKQLNTNVYDAKMRQLATAGINPFVAAGKVANVQESALHAGGQQAPHATAFPYQPYYMPVDSVSGLAAAYQALSQSDLNKVATQRIGELLAGEVEGQALDNAAKEFKLKMDIAFEGLERNAGVRKIKQEIITQCELASKYAAEGDEASANAHLARVRRARENLLGMMDQARYDRINEYIEGELEEIRSRGAKNRAEAYEANERGKEARAHAGFLNSQTLSEDAARAFEENKVRPYVAQMVMNDAQMSHNELVDYYASRPERLSAILSEFERAGIITAREREQLTVDRAKASLANEREVLGAAADFVNVVGGSARAYRDYQYGSNSGYVNRSRSRRY